MNLRSVLRVAACVFLAICHVGCGGNSRAKYIPAASAARNALQTALDTWKSGAPLKPIASPKAVINVFDARWREGKKLESFEIVEEVKNPDQPQFKVRMQLAGESEETATYLVIGIDPLNVFRDVDYEQAKSM